MSTVPAEQTSDTVAGELETEIYLIALYSACSLYPNEPIPQPAEDMPRYLAQYAEALESLRTDQPQKALAAMEGVDEEALEDALQGNPSIPAAEALLNYIKGLQKEEADPKAAALYFRLAGDFLDAKELYETNRHRNKHSPTTPPDQYMTPAPVVRVTATPLPALQQEEYLRILRDYPPAVPVKAREKGAIYRFGCLVGRNASLYEVMLSTLADAMHSALWMITQDANGSQYYLYPANGEKNPASTDIPALTPEEQEATLRDWILNGYSDPTKTLDLDGIIVFPDGDLPTDEIKVLAREQGMPIVFIDTDNPWGIMAEILSAFGFGERMPSRGVVGGLP